MTDTTTTKAYERSLSTPFERLWKRLGRQSHDLSSPDSKDDEGRPNTKTDSTKSKRRQQIYDAQKRHRNKKHEYIRDLEGELNRLRSMESIVAAQKDRLAKQNAQMRQRLAQSQSEHAMTSVPFATVAVKHDAVVGHERVFLESHIDTIDGQSTSLNTTENTWLAVDFILALEWPCRKHIPHPIMSPPGVKFVPCGSADFNGHGLTTTSNLVGGSLHRDCVQIEELPSFGSTDESLLDKWQIPYSEIEKLVKLAEEVNSDADLLTPAQAYAKIKAECPTQLLQSVLGSMKALLSDLIYCEGFGSVLNAKSFRQMLSIVLQQHASI